MSNPRPNGGKALAPRAKRKLRARVAGRAAGVRVARGPGEAPPDLWGMRDGDGPYADRAAHPLPGLILLDLKLPKRSGHEVLAWLGQQSGLSPIPAVVPSPSQQAADIDAAFRRGANSYLVKPVLFDDRVSTGAQFIP